jgi:hypothetical protein
VGPSRPRQAPSTMVVYMSGGAPPIERAMASDSSIRASAAANSPAWMCVPER